MVDQRHYMNIKCNPRDVLVNGRMDDKVRRGRVGKVDKEVKWTEWVDEVEWSRWMGRQRCDNIDLVRYTEVTPYQHPPGRAGDTGSIQSYASVYITLPVQHHITGM